MIIIKEDIEIFNKDKIEITDIINENTVTISHFDKTITIVLINNKCYNVISYSNSKLILKEKIENVYIGNYIIIPTRIEDLLLASKNDEVLEIKSNIYKICKNIIISGFFYCENVILYFDDDTVFKIYENGYFKVNKTYYNENDNNSPYSDSHSTIILSGSYGRDCYKINNICPVNDKSYFDLNNVDIHNISEKRSDFDLRYESIVKFFNVKLFGTKYSYHHMNTPNIWIYNFTVIDSFSFELLQSPIEMDKFNSLNCNYGLSFFPPSSVDFVEIKNSFISNSIFTIKRNSNSNILLIDPTFDLSGGVSGIAPIKVCYTLEDKVIQDNGESLEYKKINYYGQSYNVVGIDSIKNKIKLDTQNLYFVHFMISDKILIKERMNETYDGDIFEISNIISDSLFVNTTILNTYIDPVVHLIQQGITDLNGIINVKIPVKFMSYKSNKIEVYEKTTRVVYNEKDIKISKITPIIKNKSSILMYDNNNNNNITIKKTNDLSTDFFFIFCNS